MNGRPPDVAHLLVHGVGEVEAALGLHHEGEHRADVLVLLVELQLEVGLVLLQVLSAHDGRIAHWDEVVCAIAPTG